MSEPQKDTEPKYQPVHTNKVGGRWQDACSSKQYQI